MARSVEQAVRSAAAEHELCDQETFEALVGDETEKVRCAVADNPNCGRSVLAVLASDDAWEVPARCRRQPQ